MKKILKIVGIFVLLIVAVLIAAPFVLEAKIGELIKNNVNSNVNATLDFKDANLSLIKSFPSAELQMEEVVLLNKAPFEGDTLFAAKTAAVTIGLMDLFKSQGESIGIKNFSLDGALIDVKVNEAEQANYDISIDDGTTETTEATSSDGFTLKLDSYAITNSTIRYVDKASKMALILDDFQHFGKGDLSAAQSELDTKTDAFVSFEFDSTNYLSKHKIKLDALIGIDLNESKFSFLKNEMLINQLALVFDGFVKLNDSGQEVAITFETPSTDFKNFLAVIPEEYSKNIEDVKTSGNFSLKGNVNGIVDDLHIPKFNIEIQSNNASFKYPDLPKGVSKVNIDTHIVNTTGILEDTYVDMDKLSFMIDEDTFSMVAHIKELLGNMKVDAKIKAKMNLANISKAYPVPTDMQLKGLLNADIATAFDMNSIEKEQYENTKTLGSLSLNDFEYASEDFASPVKLKTTAVTFNPTTVTLTELQGSTGKTDFAANGTINNLLGFMLNDENVEGVFNLSSDTFALNDFMVAETETSPETKNEEQPTTTPAEEKIKIPAFLDATINATANTVLYDNLTLKNVKGKLRIKDEKATLSDMTTTIFDGTMAFSGEVSTKSEKPSFKMNLGLDKMEIGETFKSLELFKVLAPVAEILQGKLDSEISLSGLLTDDFTPDLLSLSGNLLANIMPREIDNEKTALLSSLAGKLDFIDVKSLNLKDLKTKLEFDNGNVTVKPFTVNYKDIAVNIAGGHSFDSKLNYTATMDVPAKYLGTEVTKLLANIDDKELENLTIPVTANIGGNYTSPEVKTDLTGGMKTLTSKLIEIEKQKLIGKGKDKAKELLGDVLKSKTDGTSGENDTKENAKEILGGLLGTKKTETTTTATDSVTENKKDAVKEKAKSVLGGLLGGKKN